MVSIQSPPQIPTRSPPHDSYTSNGSTPCRKKPLSSILMVHNSAMEKPIADGSHSARTRNSFNSTKATVTLEQERRCSTLNSMLYKRSPPDYSLPSDPMPMFTSVSTIGPPLTPSVSTNRNTNMPDGHSTTSQNSTYSDGRSERYGVPHTAISQAMTVQTLWQNKAHLVTLHANMQPLQRLGF